jgi:hypothetical protein
MNPKAHLTKKLISALTLCLLSQGCVGVAIVKTRTATYQNPRVSNEAGIYGLGQPDTSQTNSIPYTTTWLEEHWGKPKSIRHVGAGGLDEVWVYKFDPLWIGVVPIVLVPIPLLLPTEREQVQFVLRDGQVISGKVRESHSVGGAFGYSVGPAP